MYWFQLVNTSVYFLRSFFCGYSTRGLQRNLRGGGGGGVRKLILPFSISVIKEKDFLVGVIFFKGDFFWEVGSISKKDLSNISQFKSKSLIWKYEYESWDWVRQPWNSFYMSIHFQHASLVFKVSLIPIRYINILLKW